mmetsp:Transcript_34127/g.53367  ORF Transcript_34127/g.53367 Transcript_34127/m.53367 type:complete len:125 (-) Transcript_34127:67-441(-)
MDHMILGCDLFCLIFALDSLQSYEEGKKKLQRIRHVKGEQNKEFTLMLIGNKLDLCEKQREVATKEAEEFAKSEGMPYMEVSALTSDGCKGDEGFVSELLRIYEKQSYPQLERCGIGNNIKKAR